MCEGLLARDVDPSPKVQEYPLSVPSASPEPTELKETGLPVDPMYGPLALPCGGSLMSATRTVIEAPATAPLVSRMRYPKVTSPLKFKPGR